MPPESENTLGKLSRVEDFIKPRVFTYLPDEGLQGENIPSHILWNNMKVKSIQISFRSPLKLKDVFNAEEWYIRDTNIFVNKLEVEGYVGLSFESTKVSDLEVIIPVEYTITLPNGDIIKELRKVKLFRPQLELKVPETYISIDANTGFIRGRIKAKNIGRGILMMRISTTKKSPVKLETPPEHREFAQRFMSDLENEMSMVCDEFPAFKPYWDELVIWDKKDFMDLSAQERSKFMQFLGSLGSLLASDKKLLQGFVEAYVKALTKNTELIETVRKIISVYESLVSKDILLMNPLDEVILTNKEEKIVLKISLTDSVWDTYSDVRLPTIKLVSSQEFKVPIYKLFEWGIGDGKKTC
jgi:hypothetical protein